MSETEPTIESVKEGDKITVPDRKTPMTVDSVKERTLGENTVTVVARNHHGRYRFQSHSDGTTSMYASAQLVNDNVDVSRIDR